MLLGLILLLFWVCCWLAFFQTPVHTTPGRKNSTFANTTYAFAAALIVWSYSAWTTQLIAPPQVLLLAFVCILFGQALMCTAREALPLSNHDLLFTIATERTKASIYRYLHNPMYVGLLLALAGTSLAVLDLAGLFWLLFVVLPLLGVRAYIEQR